MQQSSDYHYTHTRNNSWAQPINQSIQRNSHFERFNDLTQRKTLQPENLMISEDLEIEEEINESPARPNPNILVAKPKQNSMVMRQKGMEFDEKVSSIPQKSMQSNEAFYNTASTALSFSNYFSNQSNLTQRSQQNFPLGDTFDCIDFLSSRKDTDHFFDELIEDFDAKIPNLSMSLSEEATLPKALEQQLAEFEPDNDPCGIDAETINYLISLEGEYRPDPEYLSKLKPSINAEMRAILVDWMMEVCSDFGLKRETFHYAVNYVDRYLSSVSEISKKDLQLVGVTALFIASKNEEVKLPRLRDFVKSCDGAYTAEQILEFEIKMLKGLKWLLTPPTLNNWTQWYLNQWDLFIERVVACGITDFYGPSRDMVFFRKQNDISYYRFREINQLLDACMLDAESLKYSQRSLLASFMYLTIGMHSGAFGHKEISEVCAKNSSAFLEKKSQFNELFGDFLDYCFAMQLSEIATTVEYAAKFFKLTLSLELPRILQIKKKEGKLNGHFEEFLSYQTFNAKAMEYVKAMTKTSK